MTKLLVISDEDALRVWQVELLKRLMDVPGLDWTQWWVAAGAAGRPPRLHKWLRRLDADRSGDGRDVEASVLAAPAGAPACRSATATNEGGRIEFSAGELARWPTHDDGLVLWLCAMPPGPAVRAAMGRRLWCLQIDGHQASHWNAGAAGMRQAPHVSTLELVALSDHGETVLYRSVSAVLRNSLVGTRRRALSKAAALPARVLAAEFVRPPLTANGDVAKVASQAPRVLPGAVRILATMIGQVLRNRWQRTLYLDQWQLAYTRNGELPWSDFRRWNFLVPPVDRFWADPLPVRFEQRDWIFFEELPYASLRGRLMAIEIDGLGHPVGTPQPAIIQDIHLSYPFVFVHEGVLYMVPETADRAEVALYRCTRCPDRWERVTTLLSGVRAHDATLHRAPDGRWWMWVAVCEPGAEPGEELHLYHASEPQGPWTAHPHNPLISDIRCARPAGPLRQSHQGLIRPAQDSGDAYGHHIHWRLIRTLSETDYEESELEELRPRGDRRWLRMHTAAEHGAMRVVDVMVRRWRFWA